MRSLHHANRMIEFGDWFFVFYINYAHKTAKILSRIVGMRKF